MPRMLGMRGVPPTDPQGLPPEVAALIAQLQQQVQDQAQQLSERDKALAKRGEELAQRDALLQRKDREIALREAKIEKINFELARLKRWTYGAKSEAMSADQRRLFEVRLPLKTGVHSPIIKRQICAAPPASVARTASG